MRPVVPRRLGMRLMFLAAVASAAISAGAAVAGSGNGAAARTRSAHSRTAARRGDRAQAEARRYLADLSSSRYSKRQAAVRYFLTTGSVNGPMLRRQLRQADSPQLRHTLAVLLRKIHIADLLSPTFITLRLKHASPQEVLAAIGKQIHTRFAHSPANLWVGAALPKRIDFNVSHVPFWAAMEKLREQTGLGCAAGAAARRLPLQAQMAGRVLPPTSIDGAFMAQAVAVDTTYNQSLMLNRAQAGPVIENSALRVAIYIEPKITIFMRGDLVVDKLVMSGGNAPLPVNANPNMNANMQAQILNGGSSHVSHVWTAVLPLSMPKAKGVATIQLLRAHWTAVIATSVARWVVLGANLSNTKTFHWDGAPVVFQGLKKAGAMYSATFCLTQTPTPGGYDPGALGISYVNWSPFGTLAGYLQSSHWLRHCPGLQANGTAETWVNSPKGMVLQVTRTWAVGPGQKGHGPIGPKAEIDLRVPTGAAEVNVPVRFRNLRLP